MGKRGRPKKIDDNYLVLDADAYIEECESELQSALKFRLGINTMSVPDFEKSIPSVVGFARRNRYTKQALYARASENEDVRSALNRITDAKEQILETYALHGMLNHTMAIFSLKQLGWSDKVEMDTDVNVAVTFEGELDESSS